MISLMNLEIIDKMLSLFGFVNPNQTRLRYITIAIKSN